jgi:hypothetical protein
VETDLHYRFCSGSSSLEDNIGLDVNKNSQREMIFDNHIPVSSSNDVIYQIRAVLA